MKHVIRAAWISYFIFFLVTSLSYFIELVLPSGRTGSFYHSLIAFHRLNLVRYIFALLSSALAVVSLWPLFVRAFSLPRTAFRFFKLILVARIVADLGGHHYETLFLRSISENKTEIAATLVATAIIFVLPSYIALFEHAFDVKMKKKK